MIFIIISDCLDICKGDLYRMLIIIQPSSEVSLYEKKILQTKYSGHKVRVHHVVCYLNHSWNCSPFEYWTSQCWFQKGKVTLTFRTARVLYHSVEKKWSRHLRKKYSGYLLSCLYCYKHITYLLITPYTCKKWYNVSKPKLQQKNIITSVKGVVHP